MTHKERCERRSEIAKAVASGKTVCEVVEEFHVCLQTVREACRVYGVKTKPMLGSTQRFRSYTLLSELINTKDSFSELSRKHNCSRQNVFHVYRQAMEAGIVMPERR